MTAVLHPTALVCAPRPRPAPPPLPPLDVDGPLYEPDPTPRYLRSTFLLPNTPMRYITSVRP